MQSQARNVGALEMQFSNKVIRRSFTHSIGQRGAGIHSPNAAQETTHVDDFWILGKQWVEGLEECDREERVGFESGEYGGWGSCEERRE